MLNKILYKICLISQSIFFKKLNFYFKILCKNSVWFDSKLSFSTFYLLFFFKKCLVRKSFIAITKILISLINIYANILWCQLKLSSKCICWGFNLLSLIKMYVIILYSFVSLNVNFVVSFLKFYSLNSIFIIFIWRRW